MVRLPPVRPADIRSLLNQAPYMLSLGTSPPGLTLSAARSCLFSTLALATSLSVFTPLRSAAWAAYTASASSQPDPYSARGDPSATVVHSYPAPGVIAEHVAAVRENTHALRRLELARRLLRHGHAAAIAETLGLARKLGMDAEVVTACLAEGPAGSWVATEMGAAMAARSTKGLCGGASAASPVGGAGAGVKPASAGGQAGHDRRTGSRSPSGRKHDRVTITQVLAELRDVFDISNSVPLATPVAGAAQQVFMLAASRGMGGEEEAT